jgi:hypothetical protein
MGTPSDVVAEAGDGDALAHLAGPIQPGLQARVELESALQLGQSKNPLARKLEVHRVLLQDGVQVRDRALWTRPWGFLAQQSVGSVQGASFFLCAGSAWQEGSRQQGGE